MRKILTIGALALASTLAGAQSPGHGGHAQGQGPGMMGGPGPGAMLAALNLSDEQREKVLAIHEAQRKKNWATMGEVRSEQFKLRGLYGAEKLDADKIVEQRKKVDELRRQMLKSRVEAHNQVAAVLTPEQRNQLRQHAPGWLGEE